MVTLLGGPSTSRLDGVMGFTVYASCYVRSTARDSTIAVEAIRALHKTSLRVPGSEPILGGFDNLSAVEPRPGFKSVAWYFSKVQFALNPPLAETVFISRLRRVARRFPADVYVHLKDDEQEIGDAARVTSTQIFRGIITAIVTAPLWTLVYLTRRRR